MVVLGLALRYVSFTKSLIDKYLTFINMSTELILSTGAFFS